MKGSSNSILKRVLDIIVSTIMMALLAMPLAVAAIVLRLSDGGPILFRQNRVGYRGKTVRIWKFRTMIVGAAGRGLRQTLRANDERITKVGRVLRNWGIDELPQLVNVLRGEMSLVGPRPTLPYQVECYTSRQRHRLEAKPGITSWAIVQGRNALTWEQRIELDIWYINHWSLWLDLRILVRTLWVVLVTREGLYGADGINDPFVPPPAVESVERGEVGPSGE